MAKQLGLEDALQEEPEIFVIRNELAVPPSAPLNEQFDQSRSSKRELGSERRGGVERGFQLVKSLPQNSAKGIPHLSVLQLTQEKREREREKYICSRLTSSVLGRAKDERI
jgi:hypothetical protein